MARREGAPKKMTNEYYSDVVRVAEYLLNKYGAKYALDLHAAPKPSAGCVREAVTQEEHDKILRLHEKQKITIREIAERFGRSPGLVHVIIRRKHKLFKNRKSK